MDRPKHGTASENNAGWLIGLAVIAAIIAILFFTGVIPHH